VPWRRRRERPLSTTGRASARAVPRALEGRRGPSITLSLTPPIDPFSGKDCELIRDISLRFHKVIPFFTLPPEIAVFRAPSRPIITRIGGNRTGSLDWILTSRWYLCNELTEIREKGWKLEEVPGGKRPVGVFWLPEFRLINVIGGQRLFGFLAGKDWESATDGKTNFCCRSSFFLGGGHLQKYIRLKKAV